MLLPLVLLLAFASLAEAGSLVGRVVDRETGAPLFEMHVRLQSPATAVNTTPSGWFALTNLEPGLYWAEISGSYHEQKFVRLAVGDTALIELRRTGYPRFEPARKFVDPTVPPLPVGSVRVRAVDEHNKPIAGVSVHVDPGGFALTDSAGWSRFPNASAGWHPIRIGSLLHENQADSVLVKDKESWTREYVLRVREPYRGSGAVLDKSGTLRVGDMIYGRDGGAWVECRILPAKYEN